jgi:multidrug resistance efflux pump
MITTHAACERAVDQLARQLAAAQAAKAYLESCLDSARADAEHARSQLAAHTCPAEQWQTSLGISQPWGTTRV